MNRKIIFLNPWDKLVGPNQYLVETLKNSKKLADQSLIIFDKKNMTMKDYKKINCKVEIWPEIKLLHPLLRLDNIVQVLSTHTIGLIKTIKRIKKLKPELIISNGENLLLGGLASKILNIKHIQIFHGLPSYRLKGKLSKNIYLQFMSFWNKRVIAISNIQKEEITSGINKNKIKLIPNPISIQNLKNRKIPENLDKIIKKHKPVLISAGEINKRKGQDLLVKALPHIKKKYPNFLCIFVGELETESADNSRKFYEKLLGEIKKSNLKRNIIFIKKTEALSSLIKKSKIYIQPSRTESFGRVIAEASLLNVPVTAFKVGGIPEVVPYAKLAELENSEGLADNILEILKNPEKARKEDIKNKKHIKEKFDSKKIARNFEIFILNLIKQ